MKVNYYGLYRRDTTVRAKRAEFRAARARAYRLAAEAGLTKTETNRFILALNEARFLVADAARVAYRESVA